MPPVGARPQRWWRRRRRQRQWCEFPPPTVFRWTGAEKSRLSRGRGRGRRQPRPRSVWSARPGGRAVVGLPPGLHASLLGTQGERHSATRPCQGRPCVRRPAVSTSSAPLRVHSLGGRRGMVCRQPLPSHPTCQGGPVLYSSPGVPLGVRLPPATHPPPFFWTHRGGSAGRGATAASATATGTGAARTGATHRCPRTSAVRVQIKSGKGNKSSAFRPCCRI